MGVILATTVSAQSAGAVSTNAGSILGKVVDPSDDPIPGANVILAGPRGNLLTVVTKEDGAFAFHDAASGAYQITVNAEGFAEWSSSVTVEAGQETTLPDVKLRILAVQRALTVSYSSKEIATQQLKAEEQQRILSVIPNIYVVYDPHPEPLTAKMKFHLAYKGLTHPSFAVLMATWAGIQQAANTPDWPQTAKGYSQRFAANYAGGAVESLVGNALLPSLLHQDPRYYYRGNGTKWSRARHAILAPFVCPGDNGKSQPNYSQWGGLLVSGAVANAYNPESNRGTGLIFKNFGMNMGFHVALGLAQEFVFGKFTSRGKH